MDKKNKNRDDKSYDIRKIFEQMELDLISSMHKAFYFHKIEEFKEGFKFEQWQLSKLRALEAYRKKNKKLVDSYNKPIQEAINRELEKSFSKGQNIFVRLINKIKKMFNIKLTGTFEFPSDVETSKGIRETLAAALGNPIAPKETDFFGANDKKLNALQEVVTKDLKKAQVSVLRKMDDVYRQTIFKTHFYLQSGTKTLNQAIDMATKDFLDKGINSIEYKNGARVNIASYAEMCLRTASHRATLLGEGKKRDEFGIHLIVVSAHGNTCKMCEPWQGQVLIDDIFSHPSKEYIEEHKEKYKLLSEAVEAGLLHPNCRHTLTTYFPGITKLPQKQDGKEAIRVYEAEQKQRTLERQIRKWKRIEAGSCDETNVQEAKKQIKVHQNKLRDLLKEHPELRRNVDREKPKTPYEKTKGYEFNGTTTKDGIDIKEPSEHLKERAEERHVSVENISDALKNPLKIGKIKIDGQGRKSKTYIGEKATVAINPDTGVIVTTYPTSSSRVRRLKGES